MGSMGIGLVSLGETLPAMTQFGSTTSTVMLMGGQVTLRASSPSRLESVSTEIGSRHVEADSGSNRPSAG